MFEELLFANVRRQVFIIRPIYPDAPGSRPIPQDRTQPPSEDEHTPVMPTSPHPPFVHRTTSTGASSDTQSGTPNQDYQARVAPILARLRAQGVEFNETPRRFNLAAGLSRAPRAASSSPALGSTSPIAGQTSPERTDTAQSIRFVSDGHTVWRTPAPEPDHGSEADHEGGSGS